MRMIMGRKLIHRAKVYFFLFKGHSIRNDPSGSSGALTIPGCNDMKFCWKCLIPNAKCPM